MTEKNTPSTSDKNEQSQATDEKTSADVKANISGSAKKASSSSTKPEPNTSRVSKSTNSNTAISSKRSITAILALLCSIIALAGLGAGYVWHKQQSIALIDSLQKQRQQQISITEAQLIKLIEQQQTATLNNAERNAQQLAEQVAIASVKPVEQELNKLRAITDNLQQNDPTDWLAHEAEYLIRVASRAMWLEKDAQVAIDLLKDADLRVKELNNPELLPVRQLINQDIETLNMLPTLATEDVILKLMALSNNIAELPIAMAHLPNSTDVEQSFELSENAADWRENLSKTWKKFIGDFITVKRRTANVEALLTTKQQQNLRQNLQLKLQLAQWAATQHKANIFKQALFESKNWLEEYFDTDDVRVANFVTAIEGLTSEVVELTLPKKLESLEAIREFIQSDINTATPESDKAHEDGIEASPAEETKQQNSGAII